MRIGFDVSQTGRTKAGCGFYADGLIRELAASDTENEYVLYPAVGDIFWDPDFGKGAFSCSKANFQRMPAPPDFESSQQFWRSPPPDFEARLGSPDIFQANNFFCPRGLEKARLIYTLHDLSFLEHPEWTTEANRLGCFSGVFQASTRGDWVVAISEYSRRHFLRTFPHYPAERTNVIYPSSRFHEGAPDYHSHKFDRLEAGSFWLSVATIEPRKNHRRLLDAYRLSRQHGLPMPLVLAGGKGWLMNDFMREIEGLELGRDIIVTGYVEDPELLWLYRNCFAFVYPSLFEGFGMPVLEAMSAAAAVICSNATSLPEVYGDAAIPVDPSDTESLAAAMLEVQRNRSARERLKDLGQARAKRFSWSESAKQLRELYRCFSEMLHYA